jgi:hypothetical protein
MDIQRRDDRGWFALSSIAPNHRKDPETQKKVESPLLSIRVFEELKIQLLSLFL